MSSIVELYADGSCLGNPGPGGIGYVIRYWEIPNNDDLPNVKLIEGSMGFRYTTNNRMEIMAAIKGLTHIQGMLSDGLETTNQISVSSDSKYLCDAINQRWVDKWQQNNWTTLNNSSVKNKDLWESIISMIDKFRSLGISVIFNHIPGHQGYEYNEKADKLAVLGSNGDTKISDEVYENTSKRK